MNTSTKLVISYSKSLFQSIFLRSKDFEIKNSDVSTIFQKGTANEKLENFFTVGQELFFLQSFLYSSSKIREGFKNPTINESQKEKLILDIFPGLSKSLRSFLKILREKNHLFLLPEIADEYDKLVKKSLNSINVKLILASPLEKELGSSFFAIFQKLTNSKEIFLNISYNPKLLGGFILEYNSIAIDLSILKEFSSLFVDI
jgi:F-type H+-transporting ATPase subunit delta